MDQEVIFNVCVGTLLSMATITLIRKYQKHQMPEMIYAAGVGAIGFFGFAFSKYFGI